MTVAIASCTTKLDYKQTLLYKSLAKLESLGTTQFLQNTHFITNNKIGLGKAYNKFIHDNPEYDRVVFVHDDVSIEDNLIFEKLGEAHNIYDIIGVAGGIEPVIKAPALWHIMCGGFGPNLRGFAGHYLPGNNQTMITNFGPTPSRVAIIDGVLMSVNIIRAREVGWKFNENYMFHHYDIASCLDANKLKLKIGVAPIYINHASPGLRSLDDPKFVESQNIFLTEYKNY